MSATEHDAMVLRAGGLAPLHAAAPEGVDVDTVAARGYRHPALGDRLVVRLSPEPLATGDDLEMEVLGFGAGEPRGQVGRKRRRALGFPGWALINDPDHARYALKVVKQFKKEARRARSKPGHAKTGIDAIADELGRSVPHFLPSFYEESGRAFIEAGALGYAAQCFGKARDAELVHALEIDESLRRDSFLEFALAGAVTIKSLTNYAKELAKGRAADEAYSHFRRLCVQRTLGGMPPWGGMAKELRRLAKTAKLDGAGEDAAVLADIIESPSLAKAAAEFWNGYRKPLIALAAESAKVRGILLNLFPQPSAWSAEFDAEWLDLLDATGALNGLWDGDADPAARPNGGGAAWLTKMCGHVARGWRGGGTPTQLFAVLRKMAPALSAEGKPAVIADRWGNIDVDLCDLALELEVPVAVPDNRASIDLKKWAGRAGEKERGRDPIRLAGDPRFATLIDSALNDAMGSEPFATVARGKRGLAAAKRGWLERLIGGASSGALPTLQRNLDWLSGGTSVHTFVEFPAAYTDLAAIDVAPALARTLAGGIFDELGWPALDEVVEKLASKEPLRLYGSFPHLVVSNGIHAIALGPEGKLLEHDLRLPKDRTPQLVRYVKGQLLVIFQDASYQWKGYWSGAPSDEFDLENGWGTQPFGGYSVVLDDGSITEGGRALTAGDTALPHTGSAVSDGETFWRSEYVGNEWQLREYNPRTGEKGRLSKPRFLEEYGRDGMLLDLQSSWVVPLPAGVDASVFGAADGLLGWRQRRRDPGQPGAEERPMTEVEAIDGRAFSGRLGADGAEAIGLVRLPGDDRPRPLSYASHWRNIGVFTLWDPDGEVALALVDNENRRFFGGGALLLPPPFWHLLGYRDVAGSTALRGVTADTAAALLAAAGVDLEGKRSDEVVEMPETAARLDALVPSITDRRLRRGVLGVIRGAAELAEFHRRMVGGRNPEDAAALSADDFPAVTDKEIGPVLRTVLGGSNYWREGTVSRQIAAVSAWFGREDRGAAATVDSVPDSEVAWMGLVSSADAIAFVCAAVGTDDAGREIGTRFLEGWRHTVFATEPGHFRYLRIATDRLPVEQKESDSWWLFPHKGNDYYARRLWSYGSDQQNYQLLEYAPGGAFALLPGVTVVEESPPLVGGGMDADRIGAFLTALGERGAMAWDPQIAEVLAARTGLTGAEATLLWAGLPNIDDYGANFLTKELRETLGLKVAQAGAAQDTLKALSRPDRVRLLASAMAENPATLWTPLGSGPDDDDSPVARMAQAWVARFGKRTPIPEPLLVAADKELQAPLKPATMLAAMANPDRSPQLTVDGDWGTGDQGTVELRGEEGALVFNSEILASAVVYLPYLFANLPVGDAIRANLPRVSELIDARLGSPGLLLSLNHNSYYEENQDELIAAFLDNVGGEPLAAPLEGRDRGDVLVVRSAHQVSAYFRPARLKAADDWDRVDKLWSALGSYWGLPPFLAARLLLSPGYRAMADRVRDTPVPAGGWEANPVLSAPELVAAAGAKWDLSEDAAALYLQTLALLAPTRKDVLVWNDWKPGRYNKATGELVARELLLEAKRERAGRAHFLPGGWEPLKSPHPPFESWKAPLYAITRTAEGGLSAPLPRYLPLQPLHEIFAAAWQRIEAGDSPTYEEVKQ